MLDWKWYLKDLKQDKDIKVFSTFSCGGGSTMGYKRAGFQVLGNVEIDPRINAVYKANHHPKYNYLMDLRDFNKIENINIPGELFHLDILDGSPPCSVFSMAGDREKNWNREKKFREGQKKQKLDDLFFVFLETVEKLQPKVVIAENVAGLLQGNAKGYVNEIIKRFKTIGYDVQIFKLNAAFMNVPQVRERVFFIANNQHYPKLKLNFNEKPILFGQVRSEKGIPMRKDTNGYRLLQQRKPGDCDLRMIHRRVDGRESQFNDKIVSDNRVCFTIAASGGFFRYYDAMKFSKQDYVNVSTFPQDYNFMDQSAHYICGMSVPPNMTANIAIEVYKQWLKK